MNYPLSHAIYNTPMRLPRYNRQMQVNTGDRRAGAVILRRLAPSLSKWDHLRLAAYHFGRSKRLEKAWNIVFERACLEAFGRPSRFGDYRITAIGCEEFSERRKKLLRHCAYNSTTHSDVAYAHFTAAGYRTVEGAMKAIEKFLMKGTPATQSG